MGQGFDLTEGAVCVEFNDLAGVEATLVLYESGRRIRELLDDLCDCLGADRPAAICRELGRPFAYPGGPTLLRRLTGEAEPC